MLYVVQPVSVTDVHGLSRAMISAWWEDEHWKTLWTISGITLVQIISDCVERQPRALIKGRDVKRHLKVIDADSGEIVGYSRYNLPGNHAGIWLEAHVARPTAEEQAKHDKKFNEVTDDGRIRGMDHEFAARFGNLLDQVEREILKEIGHCFAVDYMTTHPDHKGRGVASMILKEALKFVDEAGLTPIVMASSSAGQKVYEKQGFELVYSLLQDDSDYGTTTPYVYSWLVRKPVNSLCNSNTSIEFIR